MARDKQRALAKIIEAGAHFDDAGRAYWLAETKNMGPAVATACSLLDEARELLTSLSAAEIASNEVHKESEKYLKAIELGLDKDEYDFERFTARSVQYANRLVAGIDHLLAIRPLVAEAGEENSLENIYSLVSVPMRHLTLDAAEYLAAVIRDARVTHEVSSVVESTWAREGVPEDKRAHLQEKS